MDAICIQEKSKAINLSNWCWVTTKRGLPPKQAVGTRKLPVRTLPRENVFAFP